MTEKPIHRKPVILCFAIHEVLAKEATVEHPNLTLKILVSFFNKTIHAYMDMDR